MRILYLALDCPLPANNGLRMRTWATLRALRAEGCRIVLVCQQTGAASPAQTELRSVCESIWMLDHQAGSLTQGGDWSGRLLAACSRLPYAVRRFRANPVRALLQQLAGCERLDAIVCDTVFTAVNVPAGLAPLVVNHHNIEHRIFESYAAVAGVPLLRWAARWEGRKVREWEAVVGRRTALNLVCSDTDREQLLWQQPQARVVVAPNVVEDIAPTPSPAEDEDGDMVLFQGALDWFPNRDAVEYLLAAVWPLVLCECPHARLVIAGRNVPPAFLARYRRPGVEFTGTVPSMRPYIGRAAVCVVPLRIGSGTRLKILEAAALGKAIVATPLGAEGLRFTPAAEILLAAAPEAFAAAVIGLLREPALRRELGRAALERVRAEYSFGALCRGVHAIVQALPQTDTPEEEPAAVVNAAPVHP